MTFYIYFPKAWYRWKTTWLPLLCSPGQIVVAWFNSGISCIVTSFTFNCSIRNTKQFKKHAWSCQCHIVRVNVVHCKKCLLVSFKIVIFIRRKCRVLLVCMLMVYNVNMIRFVWSNHLFMTLTWLDLFLILLNIFCLFCFFLRLKLV